MQQFITKSLHIERITLVGPASESKGVLVWLNEKGYWIVKCGPYHDADMFPRVDINRFLIIAERWIEGTIPAPQSPPRCVSCGLRCLIMRQ